jgi:hypothetical protein
MIKAILIVWIGLGANQTLSIVPFDTLVECNIARLAIQDFSGRLDGDCITYEVTE